MKSTFISAQDVYAFTNWIAIPCYLIVRIKVKNDVNALSIRNDSDNNLFAIGKPTLSGQGNVVWGFSLP